MWALVSILLLALTVGACSAASNVAVTDGGYDENLDAHSSAVVCMVVAPTSCPDPPPHFADVQPIINSWCVACHNGASPDGPWPLLTYEHVASWADLVRTAVLTCAMPPPDAGIARMPTEDREAILKWIRCDYPP